MKQSHASDPAMLCQRQLCFPNLHHKCLQRPASSAHYSCSSSAARAAFIFIIIHCAPCSSCGISFINMIYTIFCWYFPKIVIVFYTRTFTF